MTERAGKPQRRRWQIAPQSAQAADLARRLRTSPLVAQVLCNRGLVDAQSAADFMDPKLAGLYEPQLLPDMEVASRRIAGAIKSGEKIVIYGDYDVDGMTALAILKGAIVMLGGKAEHYVPHRLEEGYGVNEQAVRKIVADGAKLLITVDCGISAAGPLAQAVAAGLDVIVTDHHAPPPELPKVLAVVHPALPGRPYPNPDLSGAGVAFKLAWGAAKEVAGAPRVDDAMRRFLLEAMCLAALGAVADVVPLTGENRILVTYGLKALPATRHAGLRALLESARLDGERLDAYHVGFVLAPRLNACGRMGHAELAVELLTDASPQRAAEIAGYLEKQNVLRQDVERQIFEQAVGMVHDGDDPQHKAIVLSCEQWHGGVIGIVAARLVERFHRPVVLIAMNGDGLGHGSARGIAGFHMRDALAACSEHLESFGGHAMAGGLKVTPDKIDAFRRAFLEHADGQLLADDLTPVRRIDAETTIEALSYAVVERLTRLAPFGQGNPPPVVALRGCRVLSPPRRMGRRGNAVSMLLQQADARLRAVGFGMGDLADELVGVNHVDVAAQPTLNKFNGATTVELLLQDVQWGSAVEESRAKTT